MTVVKNENGMALLQRPDGRKGIVIAKNSYDKLRLFILTFLDDEVGKTLNDILEKADQDFPQINNDRSWTVLQVKLDLEARGLIKAFVPEFNKRANLLKITRLGQKQLRQEKALSEMNSF